METTRPQGFRAIKEKVLEELSGAFSLITEEEVEAFCRELSPERRIFCDAAGRSRLEISGFAMRLAQMGYTVQLVGDAVSTAIRKGDVLVSCSASGGTPSILRHARTARELGALVLAITATEEAELAALADEVLLLNAASKSGNSQKSIQPMGSLFEQSTGLLLDMLVLELMDRYQITARQMSQNHSNLE